MTDLRITTETDPAPADTETVRAINLAVAAECERFVLSHSEPLLRSLVRAARVDSTERPKRMEIL